MHPAVHLNTSKALTSLWSKRKVYQKFNFRYFLICVKKDKMVSCRACLDVQIEQTRILMQ